MIKKLIMVFVGILALQFSGCREPGDMVNGGKNLPTPGVNRTLETSLDASAISFTAGHGSMDPSINIYEAYPFGLECVAPMLIPIVSFRYTYDRWPTSWDQVGPMIPLLPINRITREPFELGSYEEYSGSAPADVIIAKWNPDGPPQLFCAQAMPDCTFESITITREMFNEAIAPFIDDVSEESEWLDKPNGRFVKIMENLNATIISSFQARHRRVPVTVEEYLEDFVINPDFILGFNPSDKDTYAKFNVLVDPATNRSNFTCSWDNPAISTNDAIEWHPISEGGMIRFPATDALSGFICIFSEEMFF